MKWYTLEKHNNEWYVFKNVQKHGIASKRIFNGLYSECQKFCERKTIKLGIENKEMI